MENRHIHSWKILAGIIILFFFLVSLFGLLPFTAQVYEKQQALSSQNEQIAFMGNWKEQLLDLEYKQEVLDDRLDEMVVTLAEEKEFSLIIKELFSEAKSSSISIQKIEPINEAVNTEYNTKQVSLEVLGSYHSIARFINQIEQTGFMIETQSLELEKSKQDVLNGTIVFEITMIRS